jgi:sodium transport system ATP-binding protein
MIIVQSLSKAYRSVKRHIVALNDVSFTAVDGKITALLGPNGAGKTTALRIIAGLERQDGGNIQMTTFPNKPIQSAFGMFTESCGLYGRLTGQENIAYYGRLHGMAPAELQERMRFLTEVLSLHGLLDRRAETYSQGERMRVALARAIVHAPRHIILDEPTNGLDLESVLKLRQLLRYLASYEGGGHCVLISCHVMSEVEKLADTVVIISNGKIKATGTVNEIVSMSQSHDLEEAFFKLAYKGVT